jgi:signal transduction histidine kinase
MTETDLLDRLVAHRTLGGVPRAELEWLAAHGEILHLDTGALLSSKGVPVDALYVMLSGHFAIFIDRAAGRHKAMEWRGGDVGGLLPYSRLVNPPGDSFAQEPSILLTVHRDHFPALIRECPEITTILVHSMLDRARAFTSSDLHDEKMLSLGKLSAGLAHELNNPASAIERNASLLQGKLDEAARAVRGLSAARLTDAQLAAADAFRASCVGAWSPGVRSPIEQAEREEAIADWLAARGLDAGGAEALAETSVTLEALDRIAGAIDGPALNAVLGWAAAVCSVRSLAADIQEASMRISGLVLAIKGFTHMDQAAIAEPVDLGRSLGNTVTVLRAKARGKSAAVAVHLEPDLPRVRGFVGELNQIWANLIDNALDAIPPSGRVEVHAGREQDRVIVRVVDDGPGIPAEHRERIFEPFFTTKAMGDGTGLGLDIVRRLVRHNDGDIAVESRPGRTEFRVGLPIAADGAGGGPP